jgi:protein O-GlcNAc transferase
MLVAAPVAADKECSYRTPYSSCPLCGGHQAALSGTVSCRNHALWHPPLPDSLTWLQCASCGHIFTDSYYTDAGLSEVFLRANDNQLAGGDWERVRYAWAGTVNRIVQALPSRKDIFHEKLGWLDVGCGNGGLLFTASEFGFDAVGIDTRKEAVQRIQDMGYAALQADILTIQARKPFHVISMADVLEHVAFPLQVLARAHDLLHEQGVLFISCPNVECITWRQQDEAKTNPYCTELEHHHNFSRATLMTALRACRFVPVGYSVSPRYIACMEVLAVKSPE